MKPTNQNQKEESKANKIKANMALPAIPSFKDKFEKKG